MLQRGHFMVTPQLAHPAAVAKPRRFKKSRVFSLSASDCAMESSRNLEKIIFFFTEITAAFLCR